MTYFSETAIVLHEMEKRETSKPDFNRQNSAPKRHMSNSGSEVCIKYIIIFSYSYLFEEEEIARVGKKSIDVSEVFNKSTIESSTRICFSFLGRFAENSCETWSF